MQIGKLAPLIIVLFFVMILITARFGPALDQESMIAIEAMKLTIYNNYTLPTNYSIYGFTRHIAFGEKPLQVYIVTVPYFFLKNFLTIFDLVFVVKFLFLTLCVLTLLFFCKKITRSYNAGYLAILVLTISPIALIWYAITSWYGDFFDPILILFSVLLLLYAMDNFSKNKPKFYLCAIISLISAMSGYFIWNGGPYAIVSYVFVVFILALSKITKSNTKAVLIGMMAILIAYSIYILSSYNAGVNFDPNTILEGTIILITQQSPNLLFDSFFATSVFYPVILVSGLILFTFLPLYSIYLFFRKKITVNNDAYLVILVLLLLGIPIAVLTGRFSTLVILELAILSGIAMVSLKSNAIKVVCIIAILILLSADIYQMTYGTVPDNNNLDYYLMAAWIGQNTPPNATILTYYQDSVPIELYSSRFSYTDPWDGYNSISIMQFSNFLLQRECNFTYLAELNPSYLVVNRWWIKSSAEYDYFINTSSITNPELGGSNLDLLSGNVLVVAHNGTALLLVYHSVFTNVYETYQNQSLPNLLIEHNITVNASALENLTEESNQRCYVVST